MRERERECVSERESPSQKEREDRESHHCRRSQKERERERERDERERESPLPSLLQEEREVFRRGLAWELINNNWIGRHQRNIYTPIDDVHTLSMAPKHAQKFKNCRWVCDAKSPYSNTGAQCTAAKGYGLSARALQESGSVKLVM